MKKLCSPLILLAFFLSNSHAAVRVVECEDSLGNRTFQKVCSPDQNKISEKKLITRNNFTKNAHVNSSPQAILYVIPDCEACDAIREFFSVRNIFFTEKNVDENLELQKELTELTGALKVPTTVIGKEILIGYNRAKFLKIIENSSYNNDT